MGADLDGGGFFEDRFVGHEEGGPADGAFAGVGGDEDDTVDGIGGIGRDRHRAG
ncbi:MAG: hypothetical protein U0232_14780 [Thermomicrobiales bacterium]